MQFLSPQLNAILSHHSCNFQIARVNHLQFRCDFSCDLSQLDTVISQEFRMCSKLDAILWRFLTKVASQGTPREVFSLFLFLVMAITDKKRTTTHFWNYEEEQAVIQLWPMYPCLHNTTSSNYKRQDKRSAAMHEIRRKLKEQFDDPLNGMLNFIS